MHREFQNPYPDRTEADIAPADVSGTESELLRAELAEQKDQNLRLAADFENFKRRSRQESEVRASAQKESFIQELLPVLDNLERAMGSGASPDSRQFHQGVKLTLQQMRGLLHQHGIEIQECVGQPFDPHQHEAVALHHDPAQPDHAILEVYQSGYRRGESVFRPAKVVVNDLTHSTQARHVR